ncbi:MAG: 23S rRNA (pseudouridine(1915)-N(3))-methyltransferase RlmH [Bacteroidota bacterium]|nr:23S rRNA (pseudouridine(1915)-N(3))-methyltransferase RlmH [Bacteroidota bacterium]
MTIELAVVGKTNQSFVESGLDMYIKRIRRYAGCKVKLIKPGKFSKKMPIADIKEREGEEILKQIDLKNSFVVLLDERGKSYSSIKFASFIQKRMLSGVKKLVFVVGGAYGFSEKVKQQAHSKLSLSEMTFSHQIIRVLFAEQLYRAFTIINKEPYHNQ